MVNAGRKRRTSVFCRFFGHQDHLTYCSRCGLPSARSVSTSRPKTFVEIVGSKEPANIAVVATLAVMLLFLASVMSITAPAVGAEMAGVPEGHGSALARPGEKCKVRSLSKWTQSEQWAWTQICEARIANFNERPGGGLFDPRNVKDVENLSDRKLRSIFLETILLHEPFRSAIPRHGVRIIGAYFSNSIDLSNASIDQPLGLEQSRFESNFDLRRLTTSTIISFEGSTFEGELAMDSVTVGGNLFMGAMVEGDPPMRAEFKDVSLEGAKIGGDLYMNDSTFEGELAMDSVTVGGNLFMGAMVEGDPPMRTEFKDVYLVGAKIGGDLYMNDSTFEGKLDMYSVTVGGDLFMGKRTEFKDVSLEGAKIGGHLYMSDSTFDCRLNMDSVTVGDFLSMGLGSEFKGVFMRRANIGGVLIMTGATFEGKVIMDYAMIGSHLMIHGATFENSAILSLRHTNVGTLQDDEKVWPDILNLDGFTYESLVGMDGSDDAAYRGSRWFVKWLEKNEIYSPQPYRYLASVLRAAGHNDMANEILVASRDREREESSMSEGKWWRLTLLKFFIGYGYGNGNFWALIWALALVAVGTIVLYCTKEHKKYEEFHHWLDPFFYSLDMLLPIIRLRERHYKNMDLKTGARYYFYFHQVMGYVLIFFVIAGLSGLTS